MLYVICIYCIIKNFFVQTFYETKFVNNFFYQIWGGEGGSHGRLTRLNHAVALSVESYPVINCMRVKRFDALEFNFTDSIVRLPILIKDAMMIFNNGQEFCLIPMVKNCLFQKNWLI